MAPKTTQHFSKITYPTLLILGGLLLLAAVSCQAVATQVEPTLPSESSNPEVLPTEVAAEESELPAAEEGDQIMAAEDPNQCLVCHTDQQTLEDTADPVVVVESESSGEG